MSNATVIVLDEERRHESEVCKRGVESDFWQIVKSMLTQLKDNAKDSLVFVDPSDVSTISQCQMTAKVVDQLINAVEDTARLT